MAISFVNKSAFASGTAALTVGAVASVAADDLILLFAESANQNIATPSGFTQVTNSPVSTGGAAVAGGVRLAVFYRFATGADTTTSVADSGNHTTAIKMAFRGVDLTTPFDATPVTGIKTPASTSTSFPGITTATANAWVVHASGLDLDAASTATTGAATNANLSSITERHDQTISGGVGGGLVVVTGTKATAGATGNTTATVTSTIQVYLTMALRPAAIALTLEVTPSSYTLTGSDVDLTYTPAAAALELSVDPSSYAITGSSATLAKGSVLSVTPSSYTITGSSATITATRALTVTPGSYAITGTSVELTFTPATLALELDVTSSSYALTGSSVSLAATRALSVNPGAYAVTGSNATLARALALSVTPSSYALTGSDVDLAYAIGNPVLIVTPGAYAYTPPNVTLQRDFPFNVDGGYYDDYFDDYIADNHYGVVGYPVRMTAPTWPAPGDVTAGVMYGPTGEEFEGTRTATGSGQVWLRRR